MADRARFDQNLRPTLIAVSNADGITPVSLWADPTTHQQLLSIGSGMVPGNYDYVAYTNTDATTDTYVFKTGGSGGTTVLTITIVYVDNTKAKISTVART